MLEFEFDDVLPGCAVCGSQDIREHLVDFRGIGISRCRRCGFQFMNPPYTDRYLKEFYSSYMESEDFEYWHDALLYCHDFYLSLMEKHSPPGNLLDIGCGNGHLLEAAMRRGWSVRGYDVDDESTRSVTERLGVEVASGDFFSADLGGGYDLVTMHQVLEHLKDPVRTLGKVRLLIKPGGHLFVAVPNIRSFSNRIKFFSEKAGIRRKNVGKYYDTSHHLQFFEPKTLSKLLRAFGFQVVLKRNAHGAKPDQSQIARFIMRNFTDHLVAKSTIFVLARKLDD